MLLAKTGDLFFTRSESWLGKAIRWAETDPNETNGTWANHTGVVVSPGRIWEPTPFIIFKGVPVYAEGAEREAVVVEALWNVRRGPLKLGARSQVRLFRPLKQVGWEDLVTFCTAANAAVGQRYGWWKLLGHLADRALFKGKKRISNLFFIDKRPICSYLAAHLYDKIGIRFGMDPDAADPDEMMDYCLAHPDEWMEIKDE